MDPPIHLVADPNRDARAILELALRHAGYHPVCVPDGDSAIAVARHHPVAAIITELYLACGRERCFLHALRKDPVLRDTPVVVHTAYARESDRRWAEEAGYDAYFIKPASVVDVLTAMGSLRHHPRTD